MKVQEVITQVRAVVGDVTANQFTNEQLLAWINNGIRECAVNNNLLQKRGTQTTVVSQSDYTLPADVLKIHSVKYDNSLLDFITLEEFNKTYPGVGSDTNSNEATPCVAYVWAGVLTVYPPPSEVKQIVIDYLYTPALHVLANITSDDIALPISYHQRIVDYCLAQIALQDDNLEYYGIKMQEFKTGIQELKDQPEYSYDLYPSMSVSERDMGEEVGFLW